MPARAKHLPNHFERTILQKLRTRDELSARNLEPTGHGIILKLMAKGWIERGTSSGHYRITPAGDAALRTPLPIKPTDPTDSV
jgi:hypothetical protein